MAGVSGISGVSVSYSKIASGKRINSAADDAAGSTISEKLKSQANAMSANMDNDKSGINAANVADGALGGVQDYLQKIKTLSVKAANGLNTQGDKEAIQEEIKGYLKGIDELTGNTQYNTKKLIDGSSDPVAIASNPDGSGQEINFGDSTVKSLGLEGYDVTGDFDMSRVDDALAAVSSQRSSVGASTNALESAYNYSAYSSQLTTGANSRIEDLDIPSAVSKQKQEKITLDYQTSMQRKKMEDEKNSVDRLFNGL